MWRQRVSFLTIRMVFVTPVVEHWLEREIAQWVHPMKDRSERSFHGATSRSPKFEGYLFEYVFVILI